MAKPPIGTLIPIGAVGDASPSDVLAGKSFSADVGVDVLGTMPNRGAINNTITTQNGQIIIPEGYHNGSGIVKATLPSKDAQTYTPGTTNQIIPAGQYLAGNQTILGDVNLVPGNIKSGVNIFNTIGTLKEGVTFNVQQGYTCPDYTTTNVPISNVDINKSIVLLNWGIYENYPNKTFVMGKLTNNTNLQLTRNATSLNFVFWQVISFQNNISIIKGETVLPNGSTNIAVDLATIDLSKSFLVFSYKTDNTGQIWEQTILGYCWYNEYQGKFQLNFERKSSVGNTNIYWYLVSLN